VLLLSVVLRVLGVLEVVLRVVEVLRLVQWVLEELLELEEQSVQVELMVVVLIELFPRLVV
jgi:hypothetical protein